MDKEKFLEIMADVVNEEPEDISMDTELSSLDEWDSVAFVAFLAGMSDYTDRKIKPQQVREAAKMSDLYHLAFD